MKTLELNQMEIIEGGQESKDEGGLDSKDFACAFVGIAYGLLNPVLGFAMGLACVAMEV